MKIVNVNGRLETSGTWEETEAQATAQVACIAQQRAELRAMLSGNVQFHEDPHATVWAVHQGQTRTATVWAVHQGQTRTATGGSASLHNLPKAPKPPAVLWSVCDRVMTTYDGPATVTRVYDEDTDPLFNGVVGVKLDRDGREGVTDAKSLRPLLQPTAPKPIAPKPIAPKPPAVWRTAAQIPQSERNGLWFFYSISPEHAHAKERLFSTKYGFYLRAPEGTKPDTNTKYDPSMYQQPDADGWFAHDPREDSVCPVPAGVKYEVRLRNGREISGPVVPGSWQLGHDLDPTPHPIDVVAWRVVA